MRDTFATCYEWFYSQAELDKARLVQPPSTNFRAAWQWVHDQAKVYFWALADEEDAAKAAAEEKKREEEEKQEVWELVDAESGKRVVAVLD